ncbi:MAG: peptidase MA family metallohydrolase [Anaerolineae bacterium]
MRRWLILGAVGLLIGLTAATWTETTVARSGITFSNDRVDIKFPEKAVFEIDLQSEADIEEVVLEYGVEQLTCGTVVAKAFPEFAPSKGVQASWEWEMRKSGSEPPGATIWWRWYVTDTDGNELLTDPQTITWIDRRYRWDEVRGDSINLHWYEGDRAFAEELHTAAVDTLAYIEESMGLRPDGPIDIYIYGNFSDLRDAVYYEPGWVGGQAFTDYNIVITAVSPKDPDSLEWGRDVEAHELTHVLVHRFTFSCLFSIPAWLDEGLSEFVERGEEGLGGDRLNFETAMADDDLFSVRALGGSFPDDPDKAHLAYVQSYSIVDFLITEYGRDAILALLVALRDGVAIDDALQATYGFDQDGLEDVWREHVGVQPRVAGGGKPTPTPMPTVVPTLVPIAGVPLATIIPANPTSVPTPTPSAIVTDVKERTPTPAPVGTPASGDVGDTSLLLAGGGAVAAVALICATGVIVLAVTIFIVRRRKGAAR